MNATVVVIPTYNEAANIQGIIHAVMDLPVPFDLLVVDDNSPDGTANIVQGLQATFPQLHLEVRQNKEGLGPAYIHGFKWAMDKGHLRTRIPFLYLEPITTSALFPSRSASMGASALGG